MTNRTNLMGWWLGAALAASSLSVMADQITKPATGVTRIVFNVPGELNIRSGGDEKIVVEAEGKVLAMLDISTRGDTLTLSSKGNFRTDKGIKFSLTIKALRSLKTMASGNSTADGFSGTDLEIDLSGSGDIGLKNIKYGKLVIDLKNSGSVVAGGNGRSVVARIDGSGNIDTSNYQAQIVEARIDGSGTIRVHADESLTAAIGGAGTIEYKGKAKVTQTITGAGTIGRI